MLFMYVSIQGEDKLLTFTMDPASGRLEPQGSLAVSGRPAPLAIDPKKRFLFVGRRGTNQISSYAIEARDGGLSPVSTVGLPTNMCYLYVDRTGRYLLSTYYAAGKVAVHAIGEDGVLRDQPVEWISTAPGAHSIQTDASNRFAFVPHIASPHPTNMILQYKFAQQTGRLTPNSPEKVVPSELIGPRHYCFHPKLDMAYFCNEQGCSVTAYRFDKVRGTLDRVQEVSTIPADFKAKNMCAEIRMTPSGNCLYASNRGHNSIACFSVDKKGKLTPMSRVATEPVPRAFSLDPDGKFMFVGGLESGKLASYRVRKTGELDPLATYTVGTRPMWILIAKL